MTSDDGSIVLVYNGEIYDYPEHRARLEQDGVRFRGRSDTEVLLRLYERHGIGLLNRVNGMFAFALWDGRQRRLFLARDHAGIKPLYFHIQGHRLAFASEIKALLAVPGLTRRLNERALRAFMSFLWVPGEQTMLEGVRKLEPGHYLEWQDGEIQVRRWFSLTYEPDQQRREQDWIDDLQQTFVRATRRQMLADVPLGAFLSGGLDSSSIVGSMRAAFPDRPITAYSARFPAGDMADEQGADDYPFAERVSKHLGVDLRGIPIQPDVIALLPSMIYHLDEPDADPAVFPSYLISRAAREDGCKVLLSGTGGDEVFFGYRSHQAYSRYHALGWLPPRLSGSLGAGAVAVAGALFGAQNRLARRARKFVRGWRAKPGIERHFAVVDWADPQVRTQLFAGTAAGRSSTEADLLGDLARYRESFSGHGEINLHSHLLINTFLAAHNFLYTDKSSMAASIEVRVPFLDLELMRLAARMPEELKIRRGVGKYVLKKAMESWLPHDAIYRPKTGFGVPLRRWLRYDLKSLVHALLDPQVVVARGLFDPAAVTALVRANEEGMADHAYLVYALLVLEIWMRTFIDRPGVIVQL